MTKAIAESVRRKGEFLLARNQTDRKVGPNPGADLNQEAEVDLNRGVALDRTVDPDIRVDRNRGVFPDQKVGLCLKAHLDRDLEADHDPKAGRGLKVDPDQRVDLDLGRKVYQDPGAGPGQRAALDLGVGHVLRVDRDLGVALERSPGNIIVFFKSWTLLKIRKFSLGVGRNRDLKVDQSRDRDPDQAPEVIKSVLFFQSEYLLRLVTCKVVILFWHWLLLNNVLMHQLLCFALSSKILRWA